MNVQLSASPAANSDAHSLPICWISSSVERGGIVRTRSGAEPGSVARAGASRCLAGGRPDRRESTTATTATRPTAAPTIQLKALLRRQQTIQGGAQRDPVCSRCASSTRVRRSATRRADDLDREMADRRRPENGDGEGGEGGNGRDLRLEHRACSFRGVSVEGRRRGRPGEYGGPPSRGAADRTTGAGRSVL